MAGSLNKVMLIGNLGRDPEVRSTQAGKKVVTLNIATSETWKDRTSGERQERTEWHRVVIFNERLAETAEQYLRKGAKVYVEGAMQTRKWTDQAGVEKYSTEVVLQQFRGELAMLDGRRDGSGPAPDPDGYGRTSTRPAQHAPPSADGGGRGEFDDEIPF
ncbi:single-stranded DNA-binding protein [Allostella vacuolata]|nr:single-stranded DNA-binding protein [Stella vacuolata]